MRRASASPMGQRHDPLTHTLGEAVVVASAEGSASSSSEETWIYATRADSATFANHARNGSSSARKRRH